ARKGWVPPSRSTSKFLMGWRGLSRSAAIIFRLILLQAAKFRIESLCDEIWVPKRDGKAAVGEYIDAAESVLGGSRGQAVTPIRPGIRIQWSSACRSDVERLYVEAYGSSPRSREQKLSVAAWSQTLPERLVERADAVACHEPLELLARMAYRHGTELPAVVDRLICAIKVGLIARNVSS